MLETILQGVGSATFFAARAFIPAFVTAFLLRFGSHLPFLGDAELIKALPDGTPHWFTSNTSLGILGVLAAIELFADKSSDMRQVLDDVGRWVKPVMAVLTVLGLMGASDAGFAEEVMDGAVQPQQGDMGAGLLASVSGVVTWVLVSLRGAFFELFREGDEDDDAGVQGLMSWAEDIWATFGPLLLVLFPIMMAVLLGLVSFALHRMRRRAEVREDGSRAPCPGCSKPVYRCALQCGSCGHAVEAPLDVGFFGTTIDRAARDRKRHAFRLAEKKRCPVCATRLPERDPQQQCPECAHQTFGDPAFLDGYMGDVAKRLPFTLLVCTALSLIPIAGLLPGVIYYRIALVAPFRRYLPRGKAMAVKWGVRILFMLLVAVQWIPAVGGIVVPIMALVNYVAWRGVFLSVARPAEPETAVAPG